MKSAYISDNQHLYLQNLVFFINQELVKKVRVLNYTQLERLARDKHSSLLVPIVNMRTKLIVTNMTPESSTVDRLLNTDIVNFFGLKTQIKCFITKLWKEQLNDRQRYFLRSES